MIFTLIAEIDALEDEDKHSLEGLFREFARAASRGCHLIVLKRNICDWAVSNLHLGGKEQAQILSIKENYSTFGSILAAAPCYIDVHVVEMPLEEINPHKYRVGYKNLLRSDLLLETKLVVENSGNDGEFYKHVMGAVARVQPLNSFYFEVVNGGGGTTPNCFRQEINNRRLTLCLVDSDRYASCDSKSDTVRQIEDISAHQTYVGDIFETQCREAENYIPLEILVENRLCPTFTSGELIREKMAAQTVTYPLDCLWLYFDVKLGMRPDRMQSITNHDTRAWLESKWINAGENLDELGVEGFGNGILRQFLDCDIAVKSFVDQIGDQNWMAHFSGFFERLYWYVIADNRKAVS